MLDPAIFPQFSADEYQRRANLVRGWLADLGCDAAVIYASSYGADNVRWLTGFAPRHDTYLVWPCQGEPVLLTQLFNHVPNARRVAALPDVRWAGDDGAGSVALPLRERGIERGRVALVGRLPYADYLRLAAALPEVAWANAGKGYLGLRLVKSAEEIERLRQGAAFTDDAMAALAGAVAPGASEHELVAAIEAAYTRRGGEHGIHFLSSTPMDAPEAYVPAQTQTARRLQTGDVVICELSAGTGGYAGQIHRPIAVGAAPTARYQRLFTVALEAYTNIVGALRPGAQVRDVLDATDFIAAAGLSVCDDLLHGFGMGYLAPVVRTRATAHPQQPPDDFTFREHMAVVVQPNVYDPASGAGLQVGNLVLVTRAGAESLQRYPLEFAVRGA